jgi:hypothetical protein
LEQLLINSAYELSQGTKKAQTLSYPRFEALRNARIIDKSPSALCADVYRLIRNNAFQNFSGFEAVPNK